MVSILSETANKLFLSKFPIVLNYSLNDFLITNYSVTDSLALFRSVYFLSEVSMTIDI